MTFEETRAEVERTMSDLARLESKRSTVTAKVAASDAMESRFKVESATAILEDKPLPPEPPQVHRQAAKLALAAIGDEINTTRERLIDAKGKHRAACVHAAEELRAEVVQRAAEACEALAVSLAMIHAMDQVMGAVTQAALAPQALPNLRAGIIFRAIPDLTLQGLAIREAGAKLAPQARHLILDKLGETRLPWEN
jgi:cellobiose-specific phosphotransferase system component IIA